MNRLQWLALRSSKPHIYMLRNCWRISGYSLGPKRRDLFEPALSWVMVRNSILAAMPDYLKTRSIATGGEVV